jgi:hypothetical protein
MSITRRGILAGAGGIIAASAVDVLSSESARTAKTQTTQSDVSDGRKGPKATSRSGAREFNGIYHGDHLKQIAFPMGGIGAGMPGGDGRAVKILAPQPARVR